MDVCKRAKCSVTAYRCGYCKAHYKRLQETRAKASKKWRESPKGLAFYDKKIWRYHNDPETRLKWQESHRKSFSKHKKARLAQWKRWAETDGREYYRKHCFHLPSSTPREVLEICELTLNLKRKIREHGADS
jgi:hypothetical protein